ncbi:MULTISPECIES: hypothetical protein [Photorhabdus]|uniref:Uncharacterized protein n=3 Tax=Photorhabdus asymbiotica TaxID=291112 RepID=C7BKY2_PHOAA|nr:hypothetical protein [Photorhabdus asymbiotica]RKS57234.1 hypothetical protein BDD30_3877 [Photorhabdus asymbiotica]CAQ84405.1 conserved hypothetical protein [Photorhabdus asymbiotica]
MSWPIPEIPSLRVVAPVRYGVWGIILLLMLTIGTGIALMLIEPPDFLQVVLHGSLPAFFGWLMLFGAALNRYERFCTASQAWEAASEETHFQWQQWSRKQLAVVGNVILTPEPQGIAPLLGEQKNIPAFPDTGRALSVPSMDFRQLLAQVDQDFEQQCPGYRQLLHTIYLADVPSTDLFHDSECVQQLWGMAPTQIEHREAITSLYDKAAFEGLIMVIACQCWPVTGGKKAYSEFLSAQLFSSTAFAAQKKLNILAGMGRELPSVPQEIKKDFKMLFEYNRIDKSNMRHLWVTGVSQDALTELMMEGHDSPFHFAPENPVHLIDRTFGPPGPLSVFLASAMLTEAVGLTNSDHIIINQLPEGNAILYLMTKELHL